MAKRGRKPKPTALKARAGNPGRRPLNPAEPRPELRAPPCPKHLDTVARREWQRLSKELLKLGILSNLDRAVLVAYCEAWSQYVAARQQVAEFGAVILSEKGTPYSSPYFNQMMAAMKAMVSYAAELGMTPSSRSRVKAQPIAAGQDKSRFFKIVG